MKQLTVGAALFFAASFLLPAEIDNGRFLPAKEILVPNHIYFEAGGGLSLPLEFFNQGNIAMTGKGAHFFAGAGYNWSGWLFGLEFTHDQWGEGVGTYALMQNFKNNILELKLRRLLTKNSFGWLPEWLSIVPGLGAGVNFMTTDYYPSKRAKDEGRLNSVGLFDAGANCFFYDASLEFSVSVGTDMFIPFAGIDYNAFYDTSIGGGFAGFGRVYLGLRAYPLGIINDVQRVKSKNAAALLSASPSSDFTPDDDGVADTAVIRPGLKNLKHAPESWRIDISDPQGNPFRSWSGKGKLPAKVEWDGRSEDGEVVFSRNRYAVTLTVVPEERDRERIGEETLSAQTEIVTGILFQVIVPDKQWKIITNTIHFDADRSTFDRIPLEQQEENRETLDSIVRQIKQHGKVSVLIEGYANNVTNTERENREELIPLSTARAAAILEMLSERGLERNLLSAQGMGGANPLAQWEDHKNWWKNRRVEFIVTRE